MRARYGSKTKEKPSWFWKFKETASICLAQTRKIWWPGWKVSWREYNLVSIVVRLPTNLEVGRGNYALRVGKRTVDIPGSLINEVKDKVGKNNFIERNRLFSDCCMLFFVREICLSLRAICALSVIIFGINYIKWQPWHPGKVTKSDR